MEKIDMDRRQKKTRQAIFDAFIELLSNKNYNKITVGEIIEKANVGRATFYAHFPTKDFLLKDLCSELFDHIFYVQDKSNSFNIFTCDENDSVFLHLLKHISKNDNNIRKLLCSKNNDLFIEYFKSGVKELVNEYINDFKNKKPKNIPNDFWINHITTTFIETLRWWINNKMKQTPEEITDYFLAIVN